MSVSVIPSVSLFFNGYLWCLDMFPYQNANKIEELCHWYLYAVSTVHSANVYETQLFSIIISKGKMIEHFIESQWAYVHRCFAIL